jgi:uroporphyrinogen decarboxylase
LNSRERINRAVNFLKPDRVPIDLGAHRATGINPVIYDKLKKRLGLNTPTKIHSCIAMLAEVELEVLNAIHADVVALDVDNIRWVSQKAEEGIKKKLFSGIDVYFPPSTDIREDKSDSSWLLYNQNGAAYARMPKNGYYFDFIKPTMAGKSIDPKKFKPIDFVVDGQLQILAKRAKFLYDNTDKAILGCGNCLSIIGLSDAQCTNITQGSLDEWLCMLMTEKPTAHEMMNRYIEATIKCLKLYYQAVGDHCFAWCIAFDDAGTQIAPVMAPHLFEEMIKPHYTRLCKWVHENTNWKTFLHSCGSIYEYIPHWIEAGVDILNPVQISANNMAPSKLVDHFGGKIVFWGGGCETQQMLPLGSVEEVKAHVKENIKTFGSGSGGYIFAQVHNIQQNVPVENIEAMYISAYENSALR